MKKVIICVILVALLAVSVLPLVLTGCTGDGLGKIYIGDLECKIYESDFETERESYQEFYMGREYFITIEFLIVSKTENDGDMMLALEVEMPFTLAEDIVSYEANSGSVEIRDTINAESTGDSKSRTFHIPFNAPAKKNEVWTVRFMMKVLPLTAQQGQQIRYNIISDVANIIYDTSFNKEDNYTNQPGGTFAITTMKGTLDTPVLQKFEEGSEEIVWTHVANADYYIITVNGSSSYGGRTIKKTVSNLKEGSTVKFNIIDEGFSDAFSNICRVTIVAYDENNNFYPSESSNEIVFIYEG